MLRTLSLLIFIFFSSQSYAKSTYAGGSYADSSIKRQDTIVVFINGITNSQEIAAQSSDKLGALLGDSTYDRTFFYNNTENFVNDVSELQLQGGLSDVAFLEAGITDPSALLNVDETLYENTEKIKYYKILGGLYDAASEASDNTTLRIAKLVSYFEEKLINLSKIYKRIILVPHSQGNAYIEAAYAKLLYHGHQNVIDKIRVVGVASVAATTPNNTYITNKMDQAVYLAQQHNTYPSKVYAPLKYTDTATRLSNKLPPFHSFTDIYLSSDLFSIEKENKSFSLIIRDYITNFFSFITFSFSSNSSIPKTGEAITFIPYHNLSENIINYQWSFGDDTSHEYSKNGAIKHIYTKPGIYTVKVTSVGGFGTLNSSTQNITITDSPPTPSFSLDFSKTALDSAGATIQGVDFITGNNGRPAAKFDGLGVSTDVIYIPNKPEITFDTNEATFDIWLRLDSDKGMDGYGVMPSNIWSMSILAKSHDRLGFSWLTHNPDLNFSGTDYGYHTLGSFNSSFQCGNNYNLVSRNPGIKVGQWFRATVSTSNTEGTKFYTNKKLNLACPDMKPDFSQANIESLYLGRYSDYWYPFIGAMQDLRIYKKALSSTEIQALP